MRSARVGKRHGETDAGVVPFGAGDFACSLLWRHRDDDAEHAAADIDERAAVVGEGDVGVGLNRFAEHAAEGADDSHRDICFVGAKRAADGDGPLAGAHFGERRHGRHGQVGNAVGLEQHEHAAVIGGDEFCRRLFAGGERDEDRRRLLGEIERAGNDVAVGRNHEAGGGAVGQDGAFDRIEAADRANLDDGRRDGFSGCLEGGFFAGFERGGGRCLGQ